MKKALLIILVGLCCACGGSKKIVQNTPKTPVVENGIPKEEVDTPKVTTPIEEKAPETEIIEETPQPIVIKEEPKIDTKAILHEPWSALLAKHVTKDGIVSYKGFKQDRTVLKAYLSTLSDNMPGETWTKADKLAYWMNVYNAFTIKLIIDNYPIKSIKDIKSPWDLRFFKLGKKWYTLNDVEHRILRKMGDARIHFGINCASFSCPPLLNKAFTAQNVDTELEKLSITFVNDPKRNTITAERIQLSKIFSWFAKDFKRDGSLISFLNKYSKTTINSNAKKSFRTYDWNLNE